MVIWLNVVHGAKGINWYHYNDDTPDENYQVMQEFVHQIIDSKKALTQDLTVFSIPGEILVHESHQILRSVTNGGKMIPKVMGHFRGHLAYRRHLRTALQDGILFPKSHQLRNSQRQNTLMLGSKCLLAS